MSSTVVTREGSIIGRNVHSHASFKKGTRGTPETQTDDEVSQSRGVPTVSARNHHFPDIIRSRFTVALGLDGAVLCASRLALLVVE